MPQPAAASFAGGLGVVGSGRRFHQRSTEPYPEVFRHRGSHTALRGRHDALGGHFPTLGIPTERQGPLPDDTEGPFVAMLGAGRRDVAVASDGL